MEIIDGTIPFNVTSDYCRFNGLRMICPKLEKGGGEFPLVSDVGLLSYHNLASNCLAINS